MSDEILVRVKDLKMHFPIRAGVLDRVVGAVKAVDGVTFDITQRARPWAWSERAAAARRRPAAPFSISTDRPPERLHFRGVDLAKETPEKLRRARRHMQMIFQDPYASLNPHMRVGEIIARPLRVHGLAKNARRGEAISSPS